MSKTGIAIAATLAFLGTFSSQIAAAEGKVKAKANSDAAAETERPVRWQQSPIIFLPSLVESGEGSFIEGNAVVVFPLRWVSSTRLTQDVTLMQGDETIALKAESLLPKVRISPPGADYREAYCTRSRVAEHREGSGFSGVMFGSLLNSMQDKQVCLEDYDKDGSLDRAIVLGDGDGIIELGNIAPVVFEELIAEPMGTPDDFARLSLLRVGRDQLEIQFDIVQHGEDRRFSTMRSGRFSAEKVNVFRFVDTQRFHLLGVRFDVLDANQKENSALLKWAASAKPSEFVVIPEHVETQYRW